MSDNKSHIVLVGFMGSGKSTIGKMLADRFDMPFVDTDKKVVSRENMAISEIFDLKGETYFREVESQVLQDVLNSESPQVISTGGGAPCHMGGMKYILENGYSFYLKVGQLVLLNRIFSDKSRPLVRTKTKKELRKFINSSIREREPFYRMANRTIMANDLPEKIVERLTKYIDKR